jgi:hypothetical protein
MDMIPASTNGSSSATAEPPQSSLVLLIILSSLGGIFGLAFIIAIAITTVRVYRHPMRYGQGQEGLGRAKQSRAKGIARAMLDTIPIVKFCYERNTVRASDGDVELTGAGEPNTTSYTNDSPASHHPSTLAHDTSPTLMVAAAIGATQNESAGPKCSICTEDFVQGEDVRVLPCSHKFHPSCVDPWLLNVSGTCPLW